MGQQMLLFGVVGYVTWDHVPLNAKTIPTHYG